MASILLVEDDLAIAQPLLRALEREGFDVSHVTHGDDALVAPNSAVDIVLLDLTLPDLDGLAVCRTLRSRDERLPIIMLTARSEEADIVVGLDAGADDYITKPFGMNELLARLRAATRRSTLAVEEPLVSTGHFSIDLTAKRVTTKDGEAIRLTPTEWQLLEILARHRGRLVTGRQLLHDVWGPNYATETHYLRVYIAQLRRKLEPDPAHPHYLITEPGIGYRLQGDAPKPP
jgi:two-component system, OmpR family, KDP operon response regulator KdpE